jgi:hypothetical protein
MKHRSQALRVSIALASSSLAFAACTSDTQTLVAPATTQDVCAIRGVAASVVSIDATRLDSAIASGSYATTLTVDPAANAGDGVHFKTLTAAVAAARATRLAHNELENAACRITITAVAATLKGSTIASGDPTLEKFPIVIDVPDITIHGSTIVPLDGTGRATGAAASNATTIAPTTPLLLLGGTSSQSGVSEELFVINGHPGAGSKGHGAVIEGFVLRSGHALNDTVAGGQGVLSMRVRDVVVRNNRFEGNFTERIDLRASSADVSGNDLQAGPGSTCDICLAGPGAFTVRNNRIVGGGIPGVLVVPTLILPVPDAIEQFALPPSAQVLATVTNNEISSHTKRPVGVGMRVATMGIGAPSVIGDSRITVSNNLLRGNTFAMIVEAGFPVNGGALRGDVSLNATGNTIQSSCQNDLLVSFSRHTTGLGLSNQPYLRGSVYSLTLGAEFTWNAAWFAAPAGLANVLVVNGQLIDPGARSAYAADKACP